MSHRNFCFSCPRCGAAMTLDEDRYVCILCARSVAIPRSKPVRIDLGEPRRRGDRTPRVAGIRV